MKEREVLSSCLEFLRLSRIFAWRNNTGAGKLGDRWLRWGMKGSADIIGVTGDGRFLAVECKGDKGRVTREQQHFLSEVHKRGGVSALVHSVDDLREVLTREDVL